MVLNIADRAVAQLNMDNDMIAFNARFGGVSQAVYVPVDAVLAIYARETGMGMALPPDAEATDDAVSAADGQDEEAAPASPAVSPLRRVPSEASSPDDNGDNEPSPTPPPKRGAHLKVVK